VDSTDRGSHRAPLCQQQTDLRSDLWWENDEAEGPEMQQARKGNQRYFAMTLCAY